MLSESWMEPGPCFGRAAGLSRHSLGPVLRATFFRVTLSESRCPSHNLSKPCGAAPSSRAGGQRPCGRQPGRPGHSSEPSHPSHPIRVIPSESSNGGRRVDPDGRQQHRLPQRPPRLLRPLPGPPPARARSVPAKAGGFRCNEGRQSGDVAPRLLRPLPGPPHVPVRSIPAKAGGFRSNEGRRFSFQ